jgi:hypothetical protein
MIDAKLSSGFQSDIGVASEPAVADVGTLFLAKSFGPLFQFYIFLLLALPSGNVLGVNFKLPLYALLLPAAAAVFLQQKQRSIMPIVLLFVIPGVWLLWIVISEMYQFEARGALRQYTDFLLTLATCWMAVLFLDSRKAGQILLLRTIIFAEAFACALKVSLLGYAFIRGVPVTDIVATMDRVFGVDLMTMDLGALLGRIQFVSDGVIPLCVFATLRYRHMLRLGFVTAASMLLLFGISVLFSFSRYFWAFSALAITLGFLLARKDRTYWGLLCLGLALTIGSLPLLAGLFAVRTSQEVVTESDTTRVEQISDLKTFFWDAPILGHGLGSYTTTTIRSDADSKYGYEVQLLALLGQVGVVGASFFGALCLYYYRSLWSAEFNGLLNRVVILALLFSWLIAGFFNPLLINPVGAMSYIILLCFVRLHIGGKGLRRTMSRWSTISAQPHHSLSQAS